MAKDQIIMEKEIDYPQGKDVIEVHNKMLEEECHRT